MEGRWGIKLPLRPLRLCRCSTPRQENAAVLFAHKGTLRREKDLITVRPFVGKYRYRRRGGGDRKPASQGCRTKVRLSGMKSAQQKRLRHLVADLSSSVGRNSRVAASGMAAKAPRRVGLLGIGAIGQVVAKALLRPAALVGVPPLGEAPEPDGVEGAALCAVLVSDTAKHADKRAWLPEGVLLTDSIEAFMAAVPECVVETAGQPTVVDYGELVLRSGADFVVTSTGALTDDALHARLKAAACEVGSGRLHLASGAMPVNSPKFRHPNMKFGGGCLCTSVQI